ncbi:MAG TPA: nucleoside kinase [Lachnospiraceae bacterium]|nr:nucleoside kinase [Lachnospiraceae bacterium]
MNDKRITVAVNNEEREYPRGVTYEDIAREYQSQYDARIVLAVADGKLNELNKKVGRGASVSFLTLKDQSGYQTYKRSACLLLVKSFTDVVGEERIRDFDIEFSISKGYFCSATGDFTLDEKLLKRVKARMDELVKEDVPVCKISYHINDAVEIFRSHNMTDKEKLFRYRRASRVNVYSLEDYHDYYYGYMVPSTGYITAYDLHLYDDGFILQLPTRKNPGVVPDIQVPGKLYKTMKETTEWAKRLGVATVGDLNDKICAGEFNDLVLVQEAMQESGIVRIAEDIAAREGIKFVMIAGPSSSGKTTFSHRLSVQLRAHGFVPHTIALDDYFKNREDTPLDEDGKYNFECLEAIDIEGFNRDMTALLAGETVELPFFNFKTGSREYRGNYKRLGADDILVIEGIHGLNEKMSYALPKESKYKVYISSLTTLNVDEHNRIATTDGRLIRRMVRDHRTRGTSARNTLAMWSSVRRGEEEYIFPFQESADAMFNSALVYELCILKQFAEPLLFAIGKDDSEYLEAKRLLKFLDYFIGVTSENLPNNSIIREFVGGSMFPV